MINKYWSKALGQWLPSIHYDKVCKYLSDFLLQKALVSTGFKTKDYCISKLLCYASGDSKTIKLIATWIMDLDYQIWLPSDTENVEGDEYSLESLVPSGIVMTIHHKYYAMKYLTESPYITA
jgi:hypothetical protein